MTFGFLAPQKEFESPTFRLGGGRSILLSYWGVCFAIVPKKVVLSMKKQHIFCPLLHIMGKSQQEGRGEYGRKAGVCRCG